MKISKLVRLSAAFALFSVSILSIYSNFKAVAAYDKMRSSANDLKRRMSDMRDAANQLSKQMKVQNRHTEELIEVLSEVADANYEMNMVDESGDEKSSVFYTVKEYDGIIGVFNEENELVDEENLVVASLSQSDRKDLEIGIKVKGDIELEKLLDGIKSGNR